MSDQRFVERDAVRTGTATQTREAAQQRSAAADRSEDHLIRGYN
jgi:hypothetical protein